MSKVRYPKYKLSKALWLKEVPEHWQETDVRMLFLENKTRNIGLIENNLLSLSYGKLKRKNIDTATGLVPASFEGYQIIEEGYLVLRFTDLQNDKKSLRVGYCPERGIITNAYVGLVPKEDVFSKYYYYLLHFLDKIKYFYNLGGGVRQSLSFKEFGRETILVPHEEEQRAIARFLDYKLTKIDRFIRKKKQLIKLLNEQKSAIINRAVTKGLDPNVTMKDSGIEWLGKIPAHWEVRKLKYVGKCQNGISAGAEYFGTGYPFISYGDVYKNYSLPKTGSGLANSSDSDKINYSVLKGDVFFTRTSETIEEIGFTSTCLNTIEDATFSGFLIRFRPYPKLLNEEFSKYYFRSSLNRRFFVKEMNLVTRASLSQDLLKRMPVLLPPVEEQKQTAGYISDECESINTAISKIEKEISLTQEYSSALIAEAVTGKIDVRDYQLSDVVSSPKDESFGKLEEEIDMINEDAEEFLTEGMEE